VRSTVRKLHNYRSGKRYISALAIVLLLVFGSPGWGASAPTPDDYFHGGATNYVFGEKEKAKDQIVTGLQQFPSDPKLNQLFALLKKKEEQKQQQQQQQKNDQDKDQQQKQDSQKNSSDQKKDQNQSKDKSDEQKKQDQEIKNADQKKDQQQQQQADQKKQDKSDQKQPQEPQQAYAAGQMTPQQAKQLLDAQKGDEMVIPVRPQGKPRDTSKPFKDW
jgi:Ca-activated chloride channel family protein